MSNLQIITPRMILRHPVPEDAPTINKAMNDVWPELQKWMSWAYDGFNTMEATREYISAWKDYALIGFSRDNGEFVVSTGLNPVAGTENEYETGYWVAKNFLGQGYATEATHAVLRYAFEGRGIKAVHIGFFEGNEKSRKIIEKLGFTQIAFHEKSLKRCSDGSLMNEYRFVRHNAAGLPPMSVEWTKDPVQS